MVVAGIKETKCFEQHFWNVDKYTLLHSGCTLPGDGEQLLRSESVGIVLDHCIAWKNDGEV